MSIDRVDDRPGSHFSRNTKIVGVKKIVDEMEIECVFVQKCQFCKKIKR